MKLNAEEMAVAERAAIRWGKSSPSFDDVISELTPTYVRENRDPNPYDVARWSRIKAVAMDLVTGVLCPVCKVNRIANPNENQTCGYMCAGKLRAQVHGPGAPRIEITPACLFSMKRAYEAGASLREVGRQHGVNWQKVRRELVSAGVAIRGVGNPVSKRECARVGCTKPAGVYQGFRPKKYCSEKCQRRPGACAECSGPVAPTVKYCQACHIANGGKRANALKSKMGQIYVEPGLGRA